MLVKLFPGARIPSLIPGDVCEIEGVQFPYLGSFTRLTDAYKMKKEGWIFFFPNPSEPKISRIHFLYDVKRESIMRKFLNFNISSIANDKTDIQPRSGPKEIFYVPIKSDDGLLKVYIKQILQELQIDIRDYKDEFNGDNHMNNMRRLIVSDANLTFEKFIEWLDVLGYSFGVTLYRPDGSVFDPSKLPPVHSDKQ